jgi:hypothetical protein
MNKYLGTCIGSRPYDITGSFDVHEPISSQRVLRCFFENVIPRGKMDNRFGAYESLWQSLTGRYVGSKLVDRVLLHAAIAWLMDNGNSMSFG